MLDNVVVIYQKSQNNNNINNINNNKFLFQTLGLYEYKYREKNNMSRYLQHKKLFVSIKRVTEISDHMT